MINGLQDKNHPYAQGFVSGSQEMKQEKLMQVGKGKFFDRLKETQASSKTPQKGKSKDKGIDIDI